MKSAWTAGLKKADATRIRAEFKGSRYLLDRLTKLIINLEKSSNSSIRSENIYELPQWECKVANELGFQRALTKIKEHIKE